MNLSIFYPLLATVPVGLLAIFLNLWRRFENAKGRKEPVNPDEQFLRTPGQSALARADAFSEKIEDTVSWFTVLPSLFLVGFLALKTSGQSLPSPVLTVVTAGLAAAFIFAGSRLIHLVKQRRTWLLGFRGERAVGEYLNQLMLHGCHVFHDFPLNGNGNLDHIVVAPSGVYAIETKTKSKRARLEDGYVVIYDGKKLQFPDWTDTDFLTQAHNQADQLARILTKYLKMPIGVEPVLTFPGWFIDRRGKSDVHVLNHKEIAGLIMGGKPVLSPDDIEKISAYLDDKCRDVAF